jgi:hypothetical protein
VRSSNTKILDVKSWIGKLSESVRSSTATGLTTSETSESISKVWVLDEKALPTYTLGVVVGRWRRAARSLTQTCLTCGPLLSGHTNIKFYDMALTVLSNTPVAPTNQAGAPRKHWCPQQAMAKPHRHSDLAGIRRRTPAEMPGVPRPPTWAGHSTSDPCRNAWGLTALMQIESGAPGPTSTMASDASSCVWRSPSRFRTTATTSWRSSCSTFRRPWSWRPPQSQSGAAGCRHNIPCRDSLPHQSGSPRSSTLRKT